MENTEQIGKVKLDYSRYPGEDLYCDGAVEDELLRIVRDLSAVEYEKVIEEKLSWPVLYHLSPLRENIVEWIPLEADARVLEVGSGCGAVTGALARKAGSVTCVDLSKKRSRINAYRNSECGNVTIHVGNFRDIEPDLPADYDLICLIGVFEYGQGYIGGERPYEAFLDILLKHLKKDGRLIIAIENQLGLKYFAGCREDHLGSYFSGIENYVDGGGVRTFTRPGLERILQSAGVTRYRFYYPYPDYKFMTTLYSDRRLPGKGELSNNLRNFDRDRMLLFDEKNAFDGITGDGLFPVFSNSFLVVAGPDVDVDYVKYSNDRAPEFRIRTQIQTGEDGGRIVRKYPLSEAACDHVRQMEAACEKLTERYRGGRLEINPCRLVEDRERGELFAEFAFAEGTPLSELLDGCLERGDLDGFHRYFQEYRERIGYGEERPATDFDLVFSNLLVAGETWTLIDYEWTFGKAIDTRELAFRAIYCYLLENEKRDRLDVDRILEELGITEADAEGFREKERDFQKFVTGGRRSMAELRDLLGGRLLEPQKWAEHWQDSEQVCRVQIYEDRGDGFREDTSYFVKDAYQGEQEITFELPVSGDVRMLRIDPAFCSCAVRILEMTFNGQRVPLERRKLLTANGSVIRPEKKGDGYRLSIVFPTVDPNLVLDLDKLGRKPKNILYVRMETVRLPLSIAQDMAGAVRKRI